MNLTTNKPVISSDVFIAPSASVIGNVELSPSSSVWYGAVIRADIAPVSIGSRATIADRAVIRSASRVGDAALISPGAVIDGADIGPGAMIGSGAIISSGVTIASGAIIRPASFVEQGVSIPANEVWAGVPARRIATVDDVERLSVQQDVSGYAALARAHADECGKTHEQIEAEALRQELMEERLEDYNSHMGLVGQEREVAEIQATFVEKDREEQRKVGTA